LTEWEILDTVQMYGMESLTARQQEILDFIEAEQRSGRSAPSVREIANHLNLRSPGSVADHLVALRRKGYLKQGTGQARSFELVSSLNKFRKAILNVPIYGTIPAGYAQDRQQEANGCISVDIESIGVRPTSRTFALEVRGDSMIGKHILSGDFAILEHGLSPVTGDVVAALIDNESTLKTFIMEKNKPYLRAENPKYPKLIPASELVIQGVMVALIRKRG
jgi:repressor LexA